jgi:hypothetical protein
MSQMPDKIWLHKDTKYSTGDIVCGYQYDFVQGIEDEGGIENFVKYVPADAFIEVKEVDLNEEIEKYLKRYSMLAVGKKDFTDIAKHFFELGMQVSNKAQKEK